LDDIQFAKEDAEELADRMAAPCPNPVWEPDYMPE